MENYNKRESGFTLLHVLLLESNFQRVNEVKFDEEVKTNVVINTSVNVSEPNVHVVVEAIVKQHHQEIEQVSVQVKMLGTFEKMGDSPISDLEVFGNVNGAAIIFPFVREQIASMTLNAGIPPILLPPFNFARAYQERKEKEV